jgi:hypothetical protein
MDFHLFEHVTRDHEFSDEYLFFRFVGESERGGYSTDDRGRNILWSNFLGPVSSSEHQEGLLPHLPLPDLEAISKQDEHVASSVWPLDEYNATLLNHVHPPQWQDPEPTNADGSYSYDMVVVGAGTAGLIAAAGSAGVGAKVALIEAHMLGGDWYVSVGQKKLPRSCF